MSTRASRRKRLGDLDQLPLPVAKLPNHCFGGKGASNEIEKPPRLAVRGGPVHEPERSQNLSAEKMFSAKLRYGISAKSW